MLLELIAVTKLLASGYQWEHLQRPYLSYLVSDQVTPPFFAPFFSYVASYHPTFCCCQIVDLLEDLLNHHSATASSRSSTLTALAKVSYRLGDGLGEEGKARVEGLLEGFRSSIALELQQRCGGASILSCGVFVEREEGWTGVGERFDHFLVCFVRGTYVRLSLIHI